MWIARIWYLVVLLGCAAGFAGVVGLPAHRDARVVEMADRVAEVEAELIRQAVAAARDDARNAARIAASAPRLHTTLADQDPPLPPEVKQSLVGQAVAQLSEGERRFALFGDDGALLAASKGVDGAGIAKDPLVKQAIDGKTTVTLRQGAGWMAAVPLPRPSRGALVALSPAPARAAVRAHGEARDKTTPSRLVVLVDEKPVAGDPDRPLRATLAEAAKTGTPAAVDIGDAPHRTRRFGVPAAPGMSIILAWPIDPPTTFKDVGGVGAIIKQGLQRMPEIAVFGGVALLVWLLGLIIANAERARVLRRLTAEVDLIAAGPELEPVELGRVPSWLRGVADSANEAAAAARKRMQSTMQTRIDQLKLAPSEVSAERPIDDSGPAERVRAVEPTPPPPREPTPPPAREPSAAPSEAPPPMPEEDADDDVSEEPATINLTPSARPSPFIDPEPSVEESREAEGEGTQELPSRRMGVFMQTPQGVQQTPLSDAPTAQKQPEPSAPAPPVEDEDDDALATIDHRHANAPLSSAPPPAIEDAEASTDFDGAWDMSLPGLDPEPTSTTDSIQLPRSAGGGSLLAQLRDKQALNPQPSGGDRTVVRPIPMALLDATTSRDPDRTAVGPAPTAPEGRDALERYYERVYQEFLEIRKRCREPAGGVDFRRFRSRLVRTRKALMERFNCVDVRFRVYIKDGRAALKAAPILDEDGS